jgi:single-strand DNA-binding protein
MNINRVVLTGNLTADPELRALPSGSSVGRLRLAVNTRRKNSQTGEWEEKPNYFTVTVWGAQADTCAQYLAKGRPIAVDGRLEWRQYTTQDGQKRDAVEVIADSVQFLGGREQADNGPAASARDTGDFEAAPAPVMSAPVSDDDIPV